MYTSIKYPTPKAHGILWKRGWEDCKSQRIQEVAMGLGLLVILEARPTKSYERDCQKGVELHQWSCQPGGEKSHEASVLHTEQ